MAFEDIREKVKRYYTEKVETHGPTAKGIDVNDPASQPVRFDQLLRVCTTDRFSLNDYGCGFGWLHRYLLETGRTVQYSGFDISESMIARAEELGRGATGCRFFTDGGRLGVADYTVACGIFYVKLETANGEWLEYVLHTLDELDRLSGRGFAFNALTKYSDADRMRPDLYYADPGFLFDHCKRKFSKQVALLHDYGLYEFTIIVRK